jgi:selenide,water dikinase
MDSIKLTQFSHGAGCGCKLSPAVLHSILSGVDRSELFPNLLVGNDTSDDAAVVDLGDGTGIISTTDFFMPIVDDPRTFGRIAAVYAMGGTPLMAIAILGWPLGKIPEALASEVVDGGRSICSEAGIPLAGGHSIDCPEPIFGLAVTGRVSLSALKVNSTGKEGDLLYLSKPIGVGMITTAQKKGVVEEEDLAAAVHSMQRLNEVGARLSGIAGVHAMTDVTGFGLLGHLLELAEGAGVGAVVRFGDVPLIHAQRLNAYFDQGAVPGGTMRNHASYAQHLSPIEGFQKAILCDPQTSGGLLISVHPSARLEVESMLSRSGCPSNPIGELTPFKAGNPRLQIT